MHNPLDYMETRTRDVAINGTFFVIAISLLFAQDLKTLPEPVY